MEKIVNGIHHISMKCTNKLELDACIAFYHEILGLPIAREWDGGIMFDTGSGLIELFTNGEIELEQGVIRHFALETKDVNRCVDAVKEAGYEVFVGPKDIEIPSEPPFQARMAFCRGPLGEEIEFFEEK